MPGNEEQDSAGGDRSGDLGAPAAEAASCPAPAAGPGGLTASVVIPTHGRRDSLLRVLRALDKQSIPAGTFEVIVICDGDVDGSAATCRALAPALSYPVRIVEQPNQGPAGARNRGVAEAIAPLIVFIDDDVVPDEHLIETHLRAQAGQELLVTIGPLLPPPDFRLNAWGAWEERALCKQYDAMAAGKWQATYRQFYTGNAAVLKRHILDAGGFDPTYRRAEDVELALRLRDRGLRFTFLPDARGWHYVRRSFGSWQRMAVAYGAADVAMARAGRPATMALATREFYRRNFAVRMLSQLCAGRPAAGPAVAAALGVLARAADGCRATSLGNALCSLIFNLSYYNGMARALGGRRQWVALLRQARAVLRTTQEAVAGSASTEAQ